VRQLIPWWARIGGKLVLSRLPAGYGLWRRLRVFQHGAMGDPAYALRVFRTHFAHARIPTGSGFTALEVGPGDSLASAVIAAAHGAVRTHLVDVGAFARADLRVYRDLCCYLRAQGLHPPDLERVRDTQTLLEACRATYGTRGLASLGKIPSQSVDFAWSHAVLEHVRRGEFAALVRETRRIIRDGGVCSHQIDLQDHLGGGLNNLRIASRWWEADWMACSGFYTNRLRMRQMIREFESAGFAVRAVSIARWDALPTPLATLAPEFRELEISDLLVKSFAVELSPV
jgi:SAM-dependent methyltransferase